jgi:hypothetical protein
MAAPDFQGPYDDFLERIDDIRRIVCSIESIFRSPGVVTTNRQGVDLSAIGPTTSVNTNAMAMVFLASSYEEFVREEVSECARLLCSKYVSLPDSVRHSIRNAYWGTTLQKLGHNRAILTKSTPKSPDPVSIGKIRLMLESAQLFVVGDDPTRIDASTTTHHSNNFRPHVVDEISSRVGVPNLISRTAEGQRIKSHFGVATSAAAAALLRPKLDEFYDRRNEIVHSLNSTVGYGVDYVLDWITLFEHVADSMKNAMVRAVANW